MARRSDLILAGGIVAAVVGFFIIMVIFFGFLMRQQSSGNTASLSALGGARVGLIDVIGPIYDARNWCREIDDFRRDNQVRAIVIRIDSPGGGVAASQELYTAIRRAREKKPVVVSMGGVAASGGFYAAIGADTIVANPGTTTGSIGVLLELTRFHELLDRIGIEAETITSGELKDAGSPFREMTSRERDYLQNYIDDAYDQFLKAVADERNLELDSARELADGRIYTGQQAYEAGLIDVLGDQYEALKIAGNMCGLGDEPKIVRPVRRTRPLDLLDFLFEEMDESLAHRFLNRPAFEYRWQPGEAP